MTTAAYMEVVERMMAIPDATIRLVYFDWSSPINRHRVPDDCGVLDFCLSPRAANARVCFEDRWQSDRFEPAGELVLFPPGFAFRARVEPGRQRTLQCRLSSDILRRGVAWDDEQLRESLNLSAPSIRHTCTRIVDELREPAFETPYVIEALCRLLAIDIVRHLSSLPSPQNLRGGLAQWRISRIEERAALDGPPPSIEELAGLCGVSRSQLMRGFKQSQQKSIGVYIEQVRLNRAKTLLINGSAVAEVSFCLGFAQSSSFSTWFRREIGITPRSYRDRHATRPPRFTSL